jgi:PhoPQ-activated pathogenicity-related protein
MKKTLIFLLLAAVSMLGNGRETALDRYVRTPDPAYKYELVENQSVDGATVYLIDMVSQNWLTPKQVNRTEWKHWVSIIKPPKVEHTTGFLMIAGGSNNNRKPRPDPMLLDFARQTNSIVTEVRMVPNQPLTFPPETRTRVEDELISFGWDQFLRGGEDTWLARLPMTKAAVRAMDTATAFMAKEGVKLEKFVVAGASKRGWTTWTTGATDSRVVAIVPLVIDMLNLKASFHKHFQAYGRYSTAIQDYIDMKIVDRWDTDRFVQLTAIEDPYSYRDRLTMPKYVVNGVGDQYWLPDSSHFYFKDLKGTKHLRYVPNADHSLRNSDAPQTVLAYYHAILTGKPLPKFEWKLDRKGTIRVKTADTPAEVRVWKASNPSARDFRLETIGPAFKSEQVTGKKGVYEVTVLKPEKGWTAFFVELTYPGPGKQPLKFTTDVLVVPETLPFPPPASTKR